MLKKLCKMLHLALLGDASTVPRRYIRSHVYSDYAPTPLWAGALSIEGDHRSALRVPPLIELESMFKMIRELLFGPSDTNTK